MCRSLASTNAYVIDHSMEELQVNVALGFQPGMGRPLWVSREYQHSGVAGETGCTLFSGIMMAHSYPSMIMESGPVKPDMVIGLPYHITLLGRIFRLRNIVD